MNVLLPIFQAIPPLMPPPSLPSPHRSLFLSLPHQLSLSANLTGPLTAPVLFLSSFMYFSKAQINPIRKTGPDLKLEFKVLLYRLTTWRAQASTSSLPLLQTGNSGENITSSARLLKASCVRWPTKPVLSDPTVFFLVLHHRLSEAFKTVSTTVSLFNSEFETHQMFPVSALAPASQPPSRLPKCSVHFPTPCLGMCPLPSLGCPFPLLSNFYDPTLSEGSGSETTTPFWMPSPYSLPLLTPDWLMIKARRG